MSKLTGWQIIKTTGISGPKSGYQTVYEHKDAAEFRLAENKEDAGEWDSYDLHECKYEMLNATKCEVEGRVACVDRTTKLQLIRNRAANKLTKEERAALHIPTDETLKAVETLENAFAGIQTNFDGIATITAEVVGSTRQVLKSILGK